MNEVLGQPRAVAAFAFGATFEGHGFNVFALGLPGSGKTTLIREDLAPGRDTSGAGRSLLRFQPRPDPPAPAASSPRRNGQPIPERYGCICRRTVDRDSQAFDSEEYGRHRDQVMQAMEGRRREILTHMDQRASDAGFQLLKGPGGLLLASSAAGKLVEAVSAGQFHIWLADDVNIALELLIDRKSAEADEAGEFPEDTVHAAVASRLHEYAEKTRAAGAEEQKLEPIAV